MRTEGVKAIAAGVLCAALACCAASGGEQTITDKKSGFEMTLLDGWAVYQVVPLGASSRDELFTELIRNGPAPGGKSYIMFSVRVKELSQGESLSSFFKDRKNRDQFMGLSLVDIQKIKLDGASGFKLSLATEDGDTDRMAVAFYYLVAGNRSYTIHTGAIKKDIFDKRAKELDAIVQSFKLLKTEK